MLDALPREPGLISPEEVWEGLLEDATLEPSLKNKDGSSQTKQRGKGICDITKHMLEHSESEKRQLKDCRVFYGDRGRKRVYVQPEQT